MKQDRSVASPPPATHFWRAAAASIRAFAEGISAERAITAMYPGDVVAPLILRSATTPATTTDPSWAGPLAALSVSEAIEELVALSAIGRVHDAGGLNINLGRYAAIVVPGRVTNVGDAGQFVQEGLPVQVRQLHVVGATLRPRKLEVIVTMTREIMEASNIEDVVRMLLTEAAGLALDANIFSNTAGSPARSAGLLNGLTPIGATAAGGADSAYDAAGLDLGNLVADIATRAGGQRPVFVASPGQATTLRFWAGGQFGTTPANDDLPIAASAGLPAGTVVALEARSLVTAIGMPSFTASKVAAVQQEDTAPADIVSGGTLATPVKSMFQIDATALKMTLWADWAMRAPHISVVENVFW